MKKISLQFFQKKIFLFLLFICYTAHSDDIPLNIKSAEKAVWNIKGSRSEGTGFFISPKLFITNFHVIDFLINRNELSEIYIERPNFSTKEIERVVGLSMENDLALLEIKDSALNYLNLRDHPFQPAEDLFVIGYPESEFTVFKKTGLAQNISNSKFSFMANRQSLSGASGSPILDENGEVIGVLFLGIHNLTFSISVNSLMDFIEKSQSHPCENILECWDEALQNLFKKAEQGSAEAQYELALYYLNRKGEEYNEEKAFELMAKSAEQAYFPAQKELINMYEKGIGVEQNKSKAFELMQELAEQGSAPVQYELAIYLDKEREEYDEVRAFELMKKSADQGFHTALYHLAKMYREGIGVEQNKQKAYEVTIKLAELGYAKAQYDFLMILYMKEEGLSAYDTSALLQVKKSSMQGHSTIQYLIGVMYLNGKGVNKDPFEAFMWMTKSAKQGFMSAQYQLGLMYLEGIGVQQDNLTALYWIQKSADQGMGLAEKEIIKRSKK